jgi:hypothetical protein
MTEFNGKGTLGKKIFIVLVVLMVLLSIKIVTHGKVLIVEDLEGQVKNEFYLPGNTFTLGYIHSVELTPAEELFKVGKDNTLMLYETIYESFGVGLPFSKEEGQLDIKDGKLILKVQRPMDSIKLRVSPIPKHWLSIGDERYELIQLIDKPDDLVKIYAVDRLGFKAFGKFYKIY